MRSSATCAKYFPSIDHEILLALLRRVIGDERLMELIEHILASHEDGQRQVWTPGGDLFDVRIVKRGLPIGNLTSQFFANMYLNPLDHFVKHEQRVGGYVCYMDDFLLFGNDRAVLRRQGEEVRRKLAAGRKEGGCSGSTAGSSRGLRGGSRHVTSWLAWWTKDS